MIKFPADITERVGEVTFQPLGISGTVSTMTIKARSGHTITRVVQSAYVRKAETLTGPIQQLYVDKLSRVVMDAIHGRQEFQAED